MCVMTITIRRRRISGRFHSRPRTTYRAPCKQRSYDIDSGVYLRDTGPAGLGVVHMYMRLGFKFHPAAHQVIETQVTP